MSAKIKNVPKNTGHKHKPKGVSTHQFQKVHWPYIPAWLIVSVGTIAAGAAEFGLAGAVGGSLSVALATLALIV